MGYYIEAPRGGSYGLEWTPAHFSEKHQEYLQYETKIKKLYLTGEAPFFGGLCGAMASGFFAASQVLSFREFVCVFLFTDNHACDVMSVGIFSNWKLYAIGLPAFL